VTDAGGHAVSGVSISWSTASGSISPGTATTDGNGQSTAQWTPGTTAGNQTASATVSGAGAASFSATVTAGALQKIRLAPDTTKLTAAGQTAQLSITTLDAFDNNVTGVTLTFTTDAPTIATVNGTGLLTAVANGTTTVRAASGSINASASVLVNIGAGTNPCTGVTMTLAVGASQTLTGSAASQFCVNGSAGAEFVAVPFYATGSGGTGSGQGGFTPPTALLATFTPLVNTTASGPPTPSVGSNAQLRGAVLTDGGRVLTRDVAWEARFRERVRNQFSPLGAAARQRFQQSSGLRHDLRISPDVVVGQSMQLNVNVNQSCSNPTLVNATVKAVSTHAIVVEDDRDPANGFTGTDYQSFASAFDSQVWVVDTENFGVPTDIDNNGRIILFFTRTVNELTPPNQNSFVGGFFFGRDLFMKTDNCGGGTTVVGSNQAEMFYLLAPDPTGAVNNNTRSTSFVKSITVGTVAHEFQHLINYSSHLYTNPVVFSAANFPEKTFLDEGLAHVAEELNYYAATGRSARTNIDANTFINPSDAYLAFGNQNAVRFREYLKNPDKYPPYSVLADTSLSVRGAIWSFLRYATDQRASSVPEKTTWFQLVNPTSDVSGISNLMAVYGSDLLTKMRDWAVANYLDDALGVSTAPAYQHLSWNTRSVETYVNGTNQANGTTFPLKVNSLLSTPVALSLTDGGAAYLRFGVAAGQIGGATVTGSGAFPATFSITVVRTK
jgi:hypothetical protein